MSDFKQSPSQPLPKQRRNNIMHDALENSSALSLVPRSLHSEADLQQTEFKSNPLLKSINNIRSNDLEETKQTASVSSTTSVSSISESSSSLEEASSPESLSEPEDFNHEVDHNSLKSADTNIQNQVSKTAPVMHKPRLWSYIKSPLKIFKQGPSADVDEDDNNDLPTSLDYVECNYSRGTSKLIKKLTNLYMMMSDPDLGLIKQSSKPKTSFSGEELYSWIIDNFEYNEDEILSFLGGRASGFDDHDARTICNVLFFMGFIVPLDKTSCKFILENSDYILQAPHFIPLAHGVPSNFDYARYLLRRVNSNKFKLQDYELKTLEDYRKTMKDSWKTIENLAQKDTAFYRRRDKEEINILKLQQQTFWRIYRPPPDSYDFLNQGADAIKKQRKAAAFPSRMKDSLRHPRLKISKSCRNTKDYCVAMSFVDPLFSESPNLNPWINGDKTVWESELAISQGEILSWTTGIIYLLQNPRGLQEFYKYLKNEFSQENLNFILACKDLEQKVTLKDFSILAEQIYKDYIMTGSPSEINIVSSIRNNLIAVLEPMISNGQTLGKEHFDIYGPAVTHITALLEKDPYKRFCKVLRAGLKDVITHPAKKVAAKSQNKIQNDQPETQVTQGPANKEPFTNSSLKCEPIKPKSNLKSASSLRQLS